MGEAPNVAMAPNGDTFAATGMGRFSVHPKSASGGGGWKHTFAGGGSASGTWRANGLVASQPYGCGVVFGTPIPPNFCGGRVVLDVTLSTPLGSLPAQLTIYCLIGAPPASASEGIRLVIPGVNNFNTVVGGETSTSRSRRPRQNEGDVSVRTRRCRDGQSRLIAARGDFRKT